MAISVVQSAHATYAGTANAVPSLAGVATTSDILCAHNANGTIAGIPAVTVTDSGTYNNREVLTSVTFATNRVGIVRLQNPLSSGTHNVTFNSSTTAADDFGYVNVSEVSGLSSSLVDQQTTNTATSTTPTTGSKTPTQANGIAYLVMGGDNTVSFSGATDPPTSGGNTATTIFSAPTNAGEGPAFFDYFIYNSTAALNFGWGTVTSGPWGAAMGLFKGVPVSGGKLLLLGSPGGI